MKIHGQLSKFIVTLLATLGPFPVVHATDVAVWKQVSTYGQGVANIRPIDGGEWVYMSDTQLPRTSPMVVVLGARAQPDENQFFSIQEEKALWEMEQSLLNEKGAGDKFRRRHGAPSLVWPKVVVSQSQICVPELQFAASRDWKSHLVCTSRTQ